MYPSPLKLITCPSCGNHYSWGGSDWSPKGSREWSDGYRVGPDWSDTGDSVGRCKACNSYIVADACVDVGLMKDKPRGVKYERFVQQVTLEEILQILSNENDLLTISNQRKKLHSKPNTSVAHIIKNPTPLVATRHFLEIDALIRINHTRRRKEKVSSEFEETFRAFASNVVERIPDQYDHAVILKAELLRNLGRFAEARQALKNINNSELKRVKRIIYFASLLHITKLLVVYRNYPHNS